MSINNIGSNYFNQVNANLAKGPSEQQAATAKAAGGGQAQEAKTHTRPDDGVTLSKLAQKQTNETSDHHQKFLQEHADEEMQSLGLAQEQETGEGGQISDRNVRNRQRNLKMDDDGDEAMRRVVGSNGSEQFMDSDQAQRLQIIDAEDYGFNMNSDVPDANLKAAEQVFETQASKGLKKVSELKPVPEAQEAGTIETRIVGFEGEPMDISDATDRRYQPALMELPESVHEIAREMAARQLAEGRVDEPMIAG